MTSSMRIDQSLTSELLAQAKRKGATAADVVAVEGDSSSVQVRLSAVDKLSKAQEKRLGLRAYFGQRSVGAPASGFSPRFRAALVGSTPALAPAGGEDTTSGLPYPAAPARMWTVSDPYSS